MQDLVPPPLPTDSDDLLWALDTARALLQRGDTEGARQWLRRAAVTARNDGRLERAVELQRIATELPLTTMGPSLSLPPIELDPETDGDHAPPPVPPAPTVPTHSTPWDAELARMFAGFDPPIVSRLRAQMTLWELRRDEEMTVPGLLHVLVGAVSVAPRLSDTWSKNINAGNFFQGMGNQLAHVDGRVVGRAPLSVVATFADAAVELVGDYAPGFADDLRQQADNTGLKLAVAGGELGERLDPGLIEVIIEACSVQRYGSHAEVAPSGARSTGLCIVVEGGLELLTPDGMVKGQVRVGQALFPESALTGAPLACAVRASAVGAVLLSAGEANTAELVATQPLLIEALTS